MCQYDQYVKAVNVKYDDRHTTTEIYYAVRQNEAIGTNYYAKIGDISQGEQRDYYFKAGNDVVYDDPRLNSGNGYHHEGSDYLPA